jgi:hypothetical protein
MAPPRRHRDTEQDDREQNGEKFCVPQGSVRGEAYRAKWHTNAQQHQVNPTAQPVARRAPMRTTDRLPYGLRWEPAAT